MDAGTAGQARVDDRGPGACREATIPRARARSRAGAGTIAGGGARVIVQRTEAPVVGYRCWVARGGGLRSTTSEDVWSRGVVEARCGDNEPHQAPSPDFGCGIHVCDSPDTALRYLERRQRWRPCLWRDKPGVGAVQLWGAAERPGLGREPPPAPRRPAGPPGP